MNGSPAKLVVEMTRCDCLPEAMCCGEQIGHGGMVALRGRRGPLNGVERKTFFLFFFAPFSG